MAGNGIIKVLWYLHWKEVYALDAITTFILSIAAGVATHYICKWLDRK